MNDSILTFLRFEHTLLQKLIKLAGMQKNALVKFDTALTEKIAAQQEELLKQMRNAEKQRLRYMASVWRVSYSEALKIHISEIEYIIKDENKQEFRALSASLKKLIKELAHLNSINRVLAYRGRNSVRSIMNLFASGRKMICNVKV